LDWLRSLLLACPSIAPDFSGLAACLVPQLLSLSEDWLLSLLLACPSIASRRDPYKISKIGCFASGFEVQTTLFK
jgi:hypothetical protein